MFVGATKVTSEHDDQTCAVASQSHLQPMTYLPGFRSEGICTMSRMPMSWRLPWQPLHGGWKDGTLPLSQRLQSLPLVSGQGLHSPSTLWCSQASQAYGVSAVSFGPGRQQGPNSVAGIASLDHMEPLGCVPSVKKVPGMGKTVPFLNMMPCW